MTTLRSTESALNPRALTPIPLGMLRPAGWLADQLRRQRDGAAGHLDQVWPDVGDSAWLGGSGEGWERGPYWLDGIVPLAFLLGDDGLIVKVRHWVDHLLEYQTDDGWMGPDASGPAASCAGLDVWPRMVIMRALLQYFSATGDERIPTALLNLARRIGEVLADAPLGEWGRFRWADLVLSLHELHRITDESWLLDIAVIAQQQGYDWRAFSRNLPFRSRVGEEQLRSFESHAGYWMNDEVLGSHGVNVTMGIRSAPIWWIQIGDDELRVESQQLLAELDRYHGQATGLFTCDEHLAGASPSQGTETCAVVEYLFSLETMLETWGADETVADRLERITFNALPASAHPDEWTHQYDQQANQVVCHVTDDRVYTNNGPDSNVFGLEPHFGCCTANRHQGWPKFTARLWMTSPDGGLVALSYAPCVIDTVVGGIEVHVEVSGEYPFADTVEIAVRVSSPAVMPVHLRIPGWADNVCVRVDDEPVEANPGSVLEVRRNWTGTTTIRLDWTPALVATRRFNDALSFSRGPIVFAAAIEERWEQVGGEDPLATWEVHPASEWNTAIATHPDDVSSIRFERSPLGPNPFTPHGAPFRLHAEGRAVPNWGVEHGAAASPPRSPVDDSGEPRELVLLPYGAARVRVTELPWTNAGR